MATFKLASLILGLLVAYIPMTNASPDWRDSLDQQGVTLVKVRIEGANTTIHESVVYSTNGQKLTATSGGTYRCNGTNNGENPSPMSTPMTALDTAAKSSGFTWDGAYSETHGGYSVTRIDESTQTTTQLWGVLLNGKFTEAGGCQQRLKQQDSVLWAYDAFNKAHFLKLDGPLPASATVGAPFRVAVSDLSTGVPLSGARVAALTSWAEELESDLAVSGLTDMNGHVTIIFKKSGIYKLKAYRDESLRSNAVKVWVLPPKNHLIFQDVTRNF